LAGREEDQRDAGCQGEGERGAWPHGHGSAARRCCVDGSSRHEEGVEVGVQGRSSHADAASYVGGLI
jgi:hypothetical protein